MRGWIPQRPLSGPEVVGVVFVAVMVLPFLIGGFFALVTASRPGRPRSGWWRERPAH